MLMDGNDFYSNNGANNSYSDNPGVNENAYSHVRGNGYGDYAGTGNRNYDDYGGAENAFSTQSNLREGVGMGAFGSGMGGGTNHYGAGAFGKQVNGVASESFDNSEFESVEQAKKSRRHATDTYGTVPQESAYKRNVTYTRNQYGNVVASDEVDNYADLDGRTYESIGQDFSDSEETDPWQVNGGPAGPIDATEMEKSNKTRPDINVDARRKSNNSGIIFTIIGITIALLAVAAVLSFVLK